MRLKAAGTFPCQYNSESARQSRKSVFLQKTAVKTPQLSFYRLLQSKHIDLGVFCPNECSSALALMEAIICCVTASHCANGFPHDYVFAFPANISKITMDLLSCYLMWNFLQAVQSPDMIQCIYGWREATVETEYLWQEKKE